MIASKKGTDEDSVRTLIKLILFMIVLAIAIRFCILSMGLNKTIDKEHRRVLSEIYQAVKHFDPQFDKTSKKILLKTNDYTIKGFNEDRDYCRGDEKSCICLCTEDSCDNAKEDSDNYCKIVDYPVDEGFFIDSQNSYRRIEIRLDKVDGTEDYVVRIGTKEDADE